MTGNFSKKLSKNKMYNILKRYYVGCDISYPQGSDSGTHPATLSAITYENKNDPSENWEQYVFFYDFDVYFAGRNKSFNNKIMDAIRLEFLEEMVKNFKNTEYPKLLNDFYKQKLEHGENLLNNLKKGESLLNTNDIYKQKLEIKEEMNQAQQEINYLNSLIEYKIEEKTL